eukprot:Skav234539  [mRNA]  locus=scaffold2556:192522:195259:- [translate_table: standard]
MTMPSGMDLTYSGFGYGSLPGLPAADWWKEKLQESDFFAPAREPVPQIKVTGASSPWSLPLPGLKPNAAPGLSNDPGLTTPRSELTKSEFDVQYGAAWTCSDSGLLEAGSELR